MFFFLVHNLWMLWQDCWSQYLTGKLSFKGRYNWKSFGWSSIWSTRTEASETSNLRAASYNTQRRSCRAGASYNWSNQCLLGQPRKCVLFIQDREWIVLGKTMYAKEEWLQSWAWGQENVAEKDYSEGQSQVDYGSQGLVVWNHPIEAHFFCSTMQGWPRILFEVYALDSYGGKQHRERFQHTFVVPSSFSGSQMVIPYAVSQRWSGIMISNAVYGGQQETRQKRFLVRICHACLQNTSSLIFSLAFFLGINPQLNNLELLYNKAQVYDLFPERADGQY